MWGNLSKGSTWHWVIKLILGLLFQETAKLLLVAIRPLIHHILSKAFIHNTQVLSHKHEVTFVTQSYHAQGAH